MDPSIMTVSGKYFHFIEPHQDQYDINDIAHALSMICRFGGHTIDFYSVAQHSVLVSHVVPKEHALAGLLHDAAEAFIGDTPTPLKRILPDFKQIEKNCEKVIFESFGLNHKLPPEVKQADLVLLATEKRDLLIEDNDTRWVAIEGIEPMPKKIYPMPPSAARRYFLDRYHQLTLD